MATRPKRETKIPNRYAEQLEFFVELKAKKPQVNSKIDNELYEVEIIDSNKEGKIKIHYKGYTVSGHFAYMQTRLRQSRLRPQHTRLRRRV